MMPDDFEPDRSCATGKVRYASRGAARSFAQRRAYAAGDRRQREFFCTECRGWHLSTHDGDTHRRRARRQRRASARRER